MPKDLMYVDRGKAPSFDPIIDVKRGGGRQRDVFSGYYGVQFRKRLLGQLCSSSLIVLKILTFLTCLLKMQNIDSLEKLRTYDALSTGFLPLFHKCCGKKPIS
jgi:hypothetical protein